MFDPRRCLIALGMAAGLACCGGCDGTPKADSTTEEATVKGTVTVLGKPATKGRVVFDPRNTSRRDAKIQTAEIGADGTYRVNTPVGRNSVTVVDFPSPSRPIEGMVTEFGLDVKPGENTFDIPVGQAANP